MIVGGRGEEELDSYALKDDSLYWVDAPEQRSPPLHERQTSMLTELLEGPSLIVPCSDAFP